MMNLTARLIDYIKSSKTELKYVNWPSKKNALKFTYLVIIISALVALFLGMLDAIFAYILNKFIL